jgi:hypothetical protein
MVMKGSISKGIPFDMQYFQTQTWIKPALWLYSLSVFLLHGIVLIEVKPDWLPLLISFSVFMVIGWMIIPLAMRITGLLLKLLHDFIVHRDKILQADTKGFFKIAIKSFAIAIVFIALEVLAGASAWFLAFIWMPAGLIGLGASIAFLYAFFDNVSTFYAREGISKA